jgi:hypothetical protein
MNNIPKEIRAKLKRLCPYVGPNIPNSVREKASTSGRPRMTRTSILPGSGMTAADSINANWNCATWMLIASTRQVAIRP